MFLFCLFSGGNACYVVGVCLVLVELVFLFCFSSVFGSFFSLFLPGVVFASLFCFSVVPGFGGLCACGLSLASVACNKISQFQKKKIYIYITV